MPFSFILSNTLIGSILEHQLFKDNVFVLKLLCSYDQLSVKWSAQLRIDIIKKRKRKTPFTLFQLEVINYQ